MERLELFTTPIAIFQHPDPDALNQAVGTHLLRRCQSEPGIKRSNYGGWHSTTDLPEDPNPAVQTLNAWVMERFQAFFLDVARGFSEDPEVGEWTTQAWGMVMGPGHSSLVHDHAESHWSGTYYVHTGDGTPPGGSFVMVDPRLSVTKSYPAIVNPSTFSIQPEPGALVLFPGWLRHYVTPYNGREPRISVAYNFSPIMPA